MALAEVSRLRAEPAAARADERQKIVRESRALAALHSARKIELVLTGWVDESKAAGRKAETLHFAAQVVLDGGG